jgi:ferric-dicitrate binding protein FerR (iron transport regulator)
MDTEEKPTRAEQAALWLIELRSSEPAEDAPARFSQWLKESPAHWVLFLEMVELERRFRRLDKQQLARIRAAVNQSDPQ